MEHGEGAPSGALVARPPSSSGQLHCQAVVHRVGEIFGEFGVELSSARAAGSPCDMAEASAAAAEAGDLTRWQLYITAEQGSSSAAVVEHPGGTKELPAVFDEVMEMTKPRKVVKLTAGCTYRILVRCYSKRSAEWGMWSDPIFTSTHHTVSATIAAIGEDYVRVQWDRPRRAPTDGGRTMAPERDPEAGQLVADVTNFELQILRERTMTKEFGMVFETGVRSHTVRNLSPATAYIVLVRYETLIGTLTAWREVGRLYTEAPIVASLQSRGDDVYTVSWQRGELPVDRVNDVDTLIGYMLPTTRVHMYELYQESPGLPAPPPQEIQASTTEQSDAMAYTYRATGLYPGTVYRVYLRAMSVEGTWGCRSNVIEVRTADLPVVSVAAVGQTFLSFSWSRPQEEACESKVEYKVNSLSSEYHLQRTVQVRDEATGEAQPHLFHLEGLLSGAHFAVSMRSYLDGEWGTWTEAKPFSTHAPGTISVVDRTETSITVGWPDGEEVATADAAQSNAAEPAKIHVVAALKEPASQDDEDSENSANIVMDKTMTCEPHLPGFLVGQLQPGTAYTVRCRTWERNPITGYEGWGDFTAPVETATLLPVPLQVLDLGEDFAKVTWRPNIGSGEEGVGASDDGREPVKYEVVVRCTDSFFLAANKKTGSAGEEAETDADANGAQDAEGEEGTEDTAKEGSANVASEEPLLHRQVIENSFTITNLRPAMAYEVSVRGCDANNRWGAWSSVGVRTLAPITTSIHEIGEDFARLMWQRMPVDDDDDDEDMGTSNRGTDEEKASGASEDDATATSGEDKPAPRLMADNFISKYSIFVYSKELLESDVRPDPVSGYHAGGKADVVRREVVASQHTSLRVGGLLPDREYVAVVRAATSSGHWGLWSEPIRFRTNSQFCIPVDHLNVGENYVCVAWVRDDEASAQTTTSPTAGDVVHLGDTTVIGQQIRVRGVNSAFSKDQLLNADVRELKVYGLQPASAYYVQLRAQGKSGGWGLWGAPVHFLTRGTIVTKAVEVAEDSLLLSWERRKVPNPNHYPTGRGVVTSYHLRVYNCMGVHTETFLADSDCPHRVTGLAPDTYYCVELKANYNDDEWGLWSSPLWCLTMAPMTVQAKVISEQFCRLAIQRPSQQRRLPEDDGNRPSEDEVIVFGELRPSIMLCVTTPILAKTPHTSSGHAKPKYHNSSLPPNAVDHRLVYQTELVTATRITEQTISSLKSNTVYSVSVRSKLPDGEWGMWSEPTWFATVPTMGVTFTDIGENFIRVDWKRHPQIIPPQVREPEKVCLGLGTISASRVRARELGGGNYLYTHLQESSATSVQLTGLNPATTYTVSVQTFNDNCEWGAWSEEGKVRTVPGMDINIQRVSEDSLWVAWARRTHLDSPPCDTDTAINTNVAARAYHIRITGPGNFLYNKEMDTNKLFFRGLMPDTVYRVHVRTQFTETGEWGLWSTRAFRTSPLMRVTFGNIGEHFVTLEWRRHLPKPSNNDNDVLAVGGSSGDISGGVASGEYLAPYEDTEDIIEQYRFKVQRVGDPTPMVFDLMPNVGSYVLSDLLPSSEYRVWVCAKGYEGVWGFWSEEARVRTLPKLKLAVQNIGEDYVKVSWERGAWEGPTEDTGVNTADEHGPSQSDDDDDDDGYDAYERAITVRQDDGAASGYKLRVTDRQGNVVVSQTASWRETTCVLSGLELASLYSVEVCAKDTYGEWGLWSDPQLFVTLNGIATYALQVGETFIDVEWTRMGATPLSSRYESEESSIAGSVNDDNAQDRIVATAGSARTTDGEDARVGGKGDIVFPTVTEPAPIVDESIPEDAIQEDGTPTQWHVRVSCKRVYAGVPPSVEAKEFYCEPEETWRRIDDIIPNATYLVTVRGRNRAGVWGHWSEPLSVNTYPLLEVQVESVGETFVNLQWDRPEHDEENDDIICFPRLDDVHNYQVHIRPRLGEQPFEEEEDEPLVDGARVYETTQPTLRLGSLLPGTRYVVLVREQIMDEDGKGIPGLWGAFSASCRFETAPPLRVIPVEIGEDYCLVEWRRLFREAEDNLSGTQDSLGVSNTSSGNNNNNNSGGSSRDDEKGDSSNTCAIIASLPQTVAAALKAKEFELHTVRLADDGATVYTGPLSLNTQEILPPTSQTHHIGSLLHNTIYAVRVRAKGTGGTWGPWSAMTKFVTQGRLQLTVQSVYEQTMTVSWMRPLPGWAHMLQAHKDRELARRAAKKALLAASAAGAAATADAAKPTTPPSPGDSSGRGSEEDEEAREERREDVDMPTGTTEGKEEREEPEAPSDALREVIIGDYSIQQYELNIQGISCDFERCITLEYEEMEACIDGLEQNQLYCVCVRSLSEKQHWSMWSSRRSVLTLCPMRVVVAHYTEKDAVLQWSREAADVNRFAALLEKARTDADKACDDRERKDLFELKRRVQEMENRGEQVSGWLDQATRQEHNALLRQDAVHHLQPENVVLGDAEGTGFHLRVKAAATDAICSPYIIDHEQATLQPSSNVTMGGVMSLAGTTIGTTGPKRRAHDTVSKRQGGGGGGGAITSARGGASAAPATASMTPAPHNGTTSPDATIKDEESSPLVKPPHMTLIDAQLQDTIDTVVISGLRPDSGFLFEVCSRNARDEWLPWSEAAAVTTLAPITLGQSRFGEHYINLFWHRMVEDKAEEFQRMTERYRTLQDRYSNFAKQDLEAKKKSLSAEEYAELVAQLRELRDCRDRLMAARQSLSDGKVEITVDPNTPIQGYLLRIVKESGEFIDHYIGRDAASDSTEAITAAFTATGLQPNNMYVCLLCADYGYGLWGLWTEPLKFMTQNLIQLEVTYMSEAFVDIEWHRMNNKKLPAALSEGTIISDRFYQEEQFYQLRIEHTNAETDDTVEEFRDMKACNVFRVDNLLPDTKYTIAVREWDPKGDWGLWCSARTCVTLPGVTATVEDAGEDFVCVSWFRQQKRIDYDNDMHVLQAGVETTGYYVRIMELSESDEEECEESAETLYAEETEEAQEVPEGSGKDESGTVDAPQSAGGEDAQEEEGEEGEESAHVDGGEEVNAHEEEGAGEEEEGATPEGEGSAAEKEAGEAAERVSDSAPAPPSPRGQEEPEKALDATHGGEEDGAEGFASEADLHLPSNGLLVPSGNDASIMGSTGVVSANQQQGDELEGVFAPAHQQQSGPLPPHTHPELCEGVQEDGHICIIRRYDAETTSAALRDCLKPNRLYCVQVMAESSGGQLGVWSEPQYYETLPTIVLSAACIDEHFVDYQWERPVFHPIAPGSVTHPHSGTRRIRRTESSSRFLRAGGGGAELPPRGPSRHNSSTLRNPAMARRPRSPVDVFVPLYTTSQYEIVITGPNIDVTEKLGSDQCSFRLGGLEMNSVYCAKIRSANGRGEPSVWSDDLNVATLRAMTVLPSQITETAISLEWGRPEQQAEQYAATSTPLHFGSREAAGYQLRVVRVSDGTNTVQTTPVLDKTFQGDVQKLEVTSLALNSAYMVSARARNVGNSGEWSRWSEERCVYTMKMITSSVAAVGEDFIRVVWERDAPDEVTITNSNGDAVPSQAHPLLDKPATRGRVYTSTYTQIHGYAISMRTATTSRSSSSEPEEYVIDVPSGVNTHTIPALAPDTVYHFSVRACYGNKVWGPWSEPVQTGTYNLLAIELKDLGEDFFSVYWQRLANSADLHGLQLGRIEETTCYELALYDYTDITTTAVNASGASHNGSGQLMMPRESAEEPEPQPTAIFIHSKQRHCRIRDLAPNRRYRVCVRRWYEPLDAFLEDCPRTEQPATDDAQLLESIERTHAVPGAWSDSAFVVTLRSLVCAVENIGEDFFTVRWERDPRAPALPTRKNFTLTKPVQCYEIRIAQLTADGTAVDTSNGACHMDEIIPPPGSSSGSGQNTTPGSGAAGSGVAPGGTSGALTGAGGSSGNTFTAQQLRPNGLYRVEMRCCIDKVWGRWSAAIYLMTLPKLQVSVKNIGEDCAVVSWQRHFSPFTLPDGSRVIIGDEESSDRYLLEISGVGCGFEVSKKLKGSKTSYTARHLEADTLYVARVRSTDSSRQSWSLWSDPLHFVTLAPLKVSIGAPGEHFVRVHWGREPQPLERYRELVMRMSSAEVGVGEPATPAPLPAPPPPAATAATPTTSAAPPVAPVTMDDILGISSGDGGEVMAKDNDEDGGMYPTEELSSGVAEVRETPSPVTTATTAAPAVAATAAVAEPAPSQIVFGDPEVMAYHLCAFNTQFTPSQAVVDKQFRSDVQNYRISNLQPDTPYVIIVRACNSSSQWGLWSEEQSLRTLKLLQLHVGQIGETYLDLRWERETGDQGVGLGSAQVPTRYLLALKCEKQGIVERVFGPESVVASAPGGKDGADADDEADRLPCYRLEGLSQATEYTVALQPRYGGDGDNATTGDWGMWSKPAVFSTLSALEVSAVTTSPYTVELSWDRVANIAAQHAVAFSEDPTRPPTRPGEEAAPTAAATPAASIAGGGVTAADVFGASLGSALHLSRGPPRTVRRYQLLAYRASDASRIFQSTDALGAEGRADGELAQPASGAVARIPDRADGPGSASTLNAAAKAAQQRGGGGAGSPSNSLTGGQGDAALSGSPNTGAADTLTTLPDMDQEGDAAKARGGRLGSGASSMRDGEGGSKTPGLFKVEEEFLLEDQPEAEATPTATMTAAGGGVAAVKELTFRSSMVKEGMTYTLGGLAVDTAYIVRIRAMDGCGEWGPWTEKRVFTPPSPPTGVTLRKVNAQYCSLQWDPPVLATPVPPPAPEGEAGAAAAAAAAEATETDVRNSVTETGAGQADLRRRATQPPVYRYIVEQLYVNAPAGGGNGRLAKSAGGAAAAAAVANSGLYDWHVVDIVSETVCAVRVMGPTSRLRCRVKCVRVVESVEQTVTIYVDDEREDELSVLANMPTSDYSDPVSMSSGTPPEAVRQLFVATLARTSATVEWTAPPKPTDGGRFTRPLYRVYLSAVGHPPSLVATAHRPSFTINDLAPATTYTVQIVAENADGMSYHNPCIRFTTKHEEDTSISQHDADAGIILGELVDPASEGPRSARRGNADGQIDIPTARGISARQRSSSGFAATAPTRPSGTPTDGGRRRRSANTLRARSSSSRDGSAKPTKKPTADGALVSTATIAAASAKGQSSGRRSKDGKDSGKKKKRSTSAGSRGKKGKKRSGSAAAKKKKGSQPPPDDEAAVRLPPLSRTM